jgi:hypothetical protein
MKRIGYLYEKIYDWDNLLLAHKNARKGKTHYKEVKKVDANVEKYLKILQQQLISNSYKTSPYKIFQITERGKTRDIYKLPYFPDRILHHAVMQILEPIWKKLFIRDTYQSIKGRGVSDGKRRIERVIRKERPIYCLKMDVRKFYPSVDNEILKKIIMRKIKCKRTLRLLFEIIDSSKGIPIGNYLSQYFGNLYLTYFDHFIKEEMREKWYFRYCDDLIVLSDEVRGLKTCLFQTFKYLKNVLNLLLKKNFQIFKIIDRMLDYLGYRFYYNFTLLRKSIVRRFKKKYNNSKSLPSYKGWTMSCDSFNLWKKYVLGV